MQSRSQLIFPFALVGKGGGRGVARLSRVLFTHMRTPTPDSKMYPWCLPLMCVESCLNLNIARRPFASYLVTRSLKHNFVMTDSKFFRSLIFLLYSGQGPVSKNSSNLFGTEKPFLKIRFTGI